MRKRRLSLACNSQPYNMQELIGMTELICFSSLSLSLVRTFKTCIY
ncbi:hypothetical protein Pint_29498 [Pistacia integerrima]|uniref:Uncharacterized protein n=1 Tax=Pistacia integerrima TaxID=434235 RepID=A0ACC0X3G0_9ROSI|nr:hypothetical protein Pint_29498 [Pistacia integerrima]